MPHEIFISYASPDQVYAEALCDRLEKDSFRCWIAKRDIPGGADWSESIIEAIDHSRLLVLVFSSHANESDHVKREVEYALSAKVGVIPLRIEDVLPTGSLRYFLGTAEWLDALGSPFAQHLDRLAVAIKDALERPRESIYSLRRQRSKWRFAYERIASHWRAVAAVLGSIALLASLALLFRPVPSDTHPAVVSFHKFWAAVNPISFSPDGRHVAAGVMGTVQLIDAFGGKDVLKVEVGDAVTAMAFSADGRYLATGSMDYIARVFEVAGGKEVSRAQFEGMVLAVAFSRQGRYVAAGSYDKTARVFEAVGGKTVSQLPFQGEVKAVAFSPDGQYVAAGSSDDTARVFEAGSGKEVSRLKFQDAVNAVAFSPDGRCVAAGSDDRAIRLFDVVGGKEMSRLEFGAPVWTVAFSPDGHYVAGGGPDNTARVFEAIGGRLVSLLKFQGFVRTIAFSPDGRYLAAGS